jgi:glycosyltransferase 2 family protein
MSEDVDAGPAPQRPARRSAGMAWKVILGLIVSVGLLWYVFRNEDPAEIWHEIRLADPLLLFLATVTGTFVFWIRAWRWKAILEPVRADTTFRSRFAATTIGFMGNNILPLRAGEFMRPYALSRLERVPLVAAFSTLVIERILDGVFIVGSLFVVTMLPGFPAGRLSESAQFATAARGFGMIVLVLLAGVAVLVAFPRPVVGALEAVASKLPFKGLRRFIIDSLEAFLAGAAILRNPRLIARASFWTVVHWLVNALAFYFGYRAFGIDLPFLAALFLQACVGLAVALPSAPGFFGPFEFATKVVLVSMWGSEESKAIGFAIGFHILLFIPVTMIGLYYAWRMGYSLRGMAHAEEVVEEAVERESGVDPDDPERRGAARPGGDPRDRTPDPR